MLRFGRADIPASLGTLGSGVNVLNVVENLLPRRGFLASKSVPKKRFSSEVGKQRQTVRKPCWSAVLEDLRRPVKMSGASMAAAPREHKHPDGKGTEVKERMRQEEGAIGGIMGSFRVLELQLVAFIIIFSASGLVPVQDLLFPVIITIYGAVLSTVVFPTYQKSSPPDLFRGNRLLQFYIVMGTAVGLFLPLAYVMGGFARGDRVAVKDAAPHLFLLSCQILTENIISGLGIFSLPVRSLLLILYTSRRLFALSDWAVATWVPTGEPATDDAQVASNPLVPDSVWVLFGRSLAIINTVYYMINLFCFLIPFFLPRAFENYFAEREKYREENPNAGIGERLKNGASKLKPSMPTFEDEKKSS